MKIPVAKPYLIEEDARSVYDTVLSGWVTQGPKVQEFETQFAKYTGAKYAVATSNCTTALHLSMLVSGIQAGDEVICPSMSFIATANSIVYVGAKPIFCEVNPQTYNLDPMYAESLITDRTKAILLVHQIGMPADLDAFRNLCDKYKLRLIEDAACAIGSEYKGTKIGANSELACFSFHPRKVITTGDGGMITTSNKDYYERLKLLRQHGMSISDTVRHTSSQVILEEYFEVGYNFRLTDIQASLGIKQLEKVDWIIAERRKIATLYHEGLKDIPFIRLPIEEDGYFTNYQSYSVFLKDAAPISRNYLMQQLLDVGISTRRGVMNAHQELAYTKSHAGINLPISVEASDKSIILPLYIPMSSEEIEYVIKIIRRLLGK